MAHLLPQNVSRETLSLLEQYVALLQKWTKAINLVGKSTENEIWDRHIQDSLQLLPLLPEHKTLVDLGSGGGLPGLVIAISRPDLAVTLVEQDQRKAAFLQETVAQLGLENTRVLARDIHTIDERFQIVTARALASLDLLCAMAFQLSTPDAVCLFPKGKNFATELATARERWKFDYQTTPSQTEADASILTLTGLSPRQLGSSQ